MSIPTEPDIAEQVKLAAEAFIYGYPLVYNMHEIVKFPSGPNLVSPEPVPYNKFGYARNLLTPEAHFVSPNNDSMYLIAICDVRSGPLVLHVPDTEDRYYVPTPQSGNFRPIMRMYQPKEPIMNGTYLLPAIQCVG